ncbi:hypothetical protein B566_EDAN018644, partial [Ephemera danica]
MARAIKDIFCRYQTLKGKQVHRKGGWDTHGLPVELQVEKELGITKEDIGKKITVEEYNQKCRETVMRFTDQWQEMTDKMGYWVDMEKPYVTYENNYIESVWHLLKVLYDKDLLYKGYTIQPYSPAAGTGLSSHELNMPGTYQDVKDTSITAQFKVNSIFDLHRPFVDEIYLVSASGKLMTRETDLIDVWFDSGAMPYAQWHYPFEAPPGGLGAVYPADFISEGVDQTRGWFFTLHSISAMVSDSVAFKNVVSTGLVLDKNGNKMSKRLGNAVDPFETLKKYGADPTRWYMITNSQPWDNLKFDLDGITEVRNKFFGTLTNTYNFFALYANLDNYSIEEFA